MARKLSKKNKQVQKIVKKVAPKSISRAKASMANFKFPQSRYTEAVGRRKVATARVRIFPGKGDMVVNERSMGQYFDEVPNASRRYLQPFEITGTKGDFAVSVKVNGSGVSSQLDAVIHGLSRALVKFNPEYRPLLKQAGLLTRDDRMRESRKMGMGGKARRQRQSPKR